MKKRGFTLIEILIAFSILVLLALLGFMAWQNQAAKARDARRKDDIKMLNIAFEDYYGDKECYPAADILEECGGDQLKPYLAQPMPCDPLTGKPYCYIYDSDDPEPECQQFRILTSLENTHDPETGTIGCAGPYFCGYEEECASFGSGFNYGFSSTNTRIISPNIVFDPGEWGDPTDPVDSPPLVYSGPGQYGCQNVDSCNNYGSQANAAAYCPITFFDYPCNNLCYIPEYDCSD